MSDKRPEPEYDEQQLRREARRAEWLARNSGPMFGLGGAVVGLALGYASRDLTVGIIAIGAGMMVGIHMGLVRSTSLLLTAQTALCQAQMERSSRGRGTETGEG